MIYKQAENLRGWNKLLCFNNIYAKLLMLMRDL